MPDKKESSGSMFDTVTTIAETQEEHDVRISILEKADKQKLEDISALKKSDEEFIQELKSIKTDFTNLENTIWKTAQSTQDVMKTTTDRLWEMLGVRDAHKHEISRTKLTSFWEFAGKLTMAGGAVVVVIEIIFGK